MSAKQKRFIDLFEGQPGPITGSEIRETREALGLTQIELALLLGASNVTINRWENEQYEPEMPGAVRWSLEYFKVLNTLNTDPVLSKVDEQIEALSALRHQLEAIGPLTD